MYVLQNPEDGYFLSAIVNGLVLTVGDREAASVFPSRESALIAQRHAAICGAQLDLTDAA